MQHDKKKLTEQAKNKKAGKLQRCAAHQASLNEKFWCRKKAHARHIQRRNAMKQSSHHLQSSASSAAYATWQGR
jgi:hypothetical protein